MMSNSFQNRPYRRVTPACALVVTLMAGNGAAAQPLDLNTPADSPLWWTLSPDLSPKELRREYRGLGATLRRYQEAVAAGLEPPLSEEEAAHLAFYSNSRLNPELTAMWEALNLFEARVHSNHNEVALKEFKESGISAEGQALILAAMDRMGTEIEAIGSTLGQKQVEFQLLMNEAEEKGYPAAALDWAQENRDTDFLASVFSRPKGEVDDLLEAMHTSSSTLSVGPMLVELKGKLPPEDWELLRAHLLAMIYRHVGSFKDFK